jgi:dipeptidyl aminopeptidase/acylaminoacyl peptidase
MIHFGPRTVRLWAATVACVSLLTTHVAGAHPAPFTINDLLQPAFPSELLAAPAGRAVAWVFDAKGVRNVWVADSRGAAPAHPVTSFSGDDGFNIGDLGWSPDMKWLAFTRGGTLESEAPTNINSVPEGPMPREVWVVAASGGAPRELGLGHSPCFAPDGNQILFVDKKKIMTAAVSGEGSAQPLIVDEGNVSALTWSPEGKRLAFVSHRGSHSIIGVYDVAGRSIVWMNPTLDYDSFPTFSPDGTRIAFVHVLAEKAPPLLVSRRSGRPWSIWTADVKTGVGRRVWTADAGVGSVFHETLSEANLFWTSHDQLVFPWEKTGWLHLYAVPAQGGTARAMTSGPFEVTHVVLSPDRQRLVYSSGQDDIDRLHVWTVDVDHGQPVPAARSRAIEDDPQTSADGTLFALQSDGNQALHPVVLSAKGQWQPLAPDAIPASFPVAKLVVPEAVTFTAKDGRATHAQIFLPRENGAKPHPAILFFHGGPRRQMLLGFNPIDAYNSMYAMNEYLAGEGYIVLSVNYRGGIGYGMEYREAEDFGPDGGSELNDLLGAVTYLQGRKDVDAHRLGIWGGSYGGLMTALGLARASDSIAAGVDYAGLYNWATLLASVGQPIEGAEANRRAVESSPVATIDKWRSPVLIVQADDDRNVPSQQATELIEGLRLHDIEPDELMIPNEIHDLTRYASWMLFLSATDAYFDQHLDKLKVKSP